MIIDHLIFLIHPCCYERLHQQDPASFQQSNLSLYFERECEVNQKWLAELARCTQATLVLQLYGPRSLFQTIEQAVGVSNACYVHADFPGADHLREYYRRLTGCIREHMAKYSIQFDPATATSELWGESFEGCVPGYGGAFAEALGLQRPPIMRFEMTVFDTRFLHQARQWETIQIRNSDIEAWLFECHEGTGATIFQSRLSAQWLDARPIVLQLNPTCVQVCTKTGHTVWPERPPRKGDAELSQTFRLTTADAYWIRGVGMSVGRLRELVASASVEEAVATTNQEVK